MTRPEVGRTGDLCHVTGIVRGYRKERDVAELFRMMEGIMKVSSEDVGAVQDVTTSSRKAYG